MPCFSPLPAIRSANNPDKVLVCKRGTLLVPFVDKYTGQLLEPFKVPCGRCDGCVVDKSLQWATRLVCESLCFPRDRCYFITLTYSNDCIHTVSRYPTLCKKDCQDFLKRLRYYFPDDTVRYYLCGEYGNTTARPHYHLILFGIKLPDLVPYSRNFQGDYLFTSAKLDSIWSHGDCKVADLTFENCAYTARYSLKKRGKNDSRDFLLSHDLEPEFSLCSRRPGIGSFFLNSHLEEVLLYDKVHLPSGRIACTPAYFLKKAQEVDPIRVAQIKSARQALKDLIDRQHCTLSGKSLDQYLQDSLEILRSQYSRLKRLL